MKILVAVPTYDGKLPVDVVKALLDEKEMARLLGDEIICHFLPGCSHLPMGRDQISKAFMESDCERLVFLDADVIWEPGYLTKICHYPYDFVGGAYRYKGIDESYPVGWIQDNNELWANEHGLLEVAALPTGFLSLSRNVFIHIKEKFPYREYTHMGHTNYCYFEMPYRPGMLMGEDGSFCTLWRMSGGKIYLDPEIKLTHLDYKPVPYEGHIGNWLKNRTQQKEV